ncbi:galactose metabolism- protein [Purpureocillium takamizusanense]|uniref:Galactose metabolism- protein n=1 Tax=Purpureocillium takamizusanense TaxID=2060973 RepID=A0A9Q8QG95_9HYPO|nr:galactose metabolism- protein [Purpureocillium takamizusanense]UNI19093.1 galactose metabolism- protein [Purpureocillium takamizusanense]
MGNNHSSASKEATSSSAAAAAAAQAASDGNKASTTTTTTSASTPTSAATSPTQPQHHHHHFASIHRHHQDVVPGRKDARNIIPEHTTHRSVAPPEASLALAQGSTTVVNRPKSSLPGTAVSSLSGSPHSNVSATPNKPSCSSSAADRHPPPRDEPSKPVDVPLESTSLRSAHHDPHHRPSHVPLPVDSNLISNSSMTDMYLRGPPRLPLPIDEEVHTPGSPILAPEEGLDDVELGSSSDALTRKSSAVSANTVDDDESEELRVDKTRPVVPTKLEWKRGGDKIYVTGTFFEWNRKQRLHPVEGKPGCFAATILILPGTHHVRFLVDGIMQTSPDLPTTVDFGNNLVNYIEVSPEDALPAQRSASKSGSETEGASRTRPPKGKPVEPPENYRRDIPQYLRDFDQPEDSGAYRNAVSAIEKLPTPPSLPGFLGKPILNAATLMKDDNSVLNMPNHTVLNHLATSSIKNNVLAVSATTRYHNKYVTTIMYKPTSADEG